MHTETLGGIAVTVFSADEVPVLVDRYQDHPWASPGLYKEIASLAELHRAGQLAADDSLTPTLYYVSSKTHRSWGRTRHGRLVLVCPFVGDLVAFGPVQAPVQRMGVRFVNLVEEVTA